MSGKRAVFLVVGMVLLVQPAQADNAWPRGARPLSGATPSAATFAAAFAPDGTFLALGGQDRCIHLWDVRAGREVARLEGHRNWVHALAFAPDGRTLVSGGRDGSVRLWDRAGTELRRLAGHTSAVLAVAFAPDGRTVASGGQDKLVRISDVATGVELRQIGGYADWTGPLAFAPDGRLLASGGWDGAVRLSEPDKGARRSNLGMPQGRVLALGFGSDGRTVIAASRGRLVRRWQVSTGELLGKLRVPVPAGHCVAISADGTLVAAGGRDGILRLWDTASGREYRPLGAQHFPVLCLAFSRDGQTLVAGGRDTPALLWDVTDATTDGRPGPRNLTVAEWNHLWADLAAGDGPDVERALWKLRQAPRRTVRFLQERYDAFAEESQQIVALIAQLDDDRFRVRQQAANRLEDLGTEAEPDLRAALRAKLPLDTQRRIQLLLARLDRRLHPPPANWLRGRRSLRALTEIDLPEAGALLDRLADGPPTFWLTQEARAAAGLK
jgi:hypothetical protein